jgi:hypothetical protein
MRSSSPSPTARSRTHTEGVEAQLRPHATRHVVHAASPLCLSLLLCRCLSPHAPRQLHTPSRLPRSPSSRQNDRHKTPPEGAIAVHRNASSAPRCARAHTPPGCLVIPRGHCPINRPPTFPTLFSAAFPPRPSCSNPLRVLGRRHRRRPRRHRRLSWAAQ